MQNIHFIPYLLSHTKIIQNESDLRICDSIIKFTDKNRKNILWPQYRQKFLGTQEALTIKEKLIIVNFINIKVLSFKRDHFKIPLGKWKGKSLARQKYSSNISLTKDTHRIYKDLLQIHTKQKTRFK